MQKSVVVYAHIYAHQFLKISKENLYKIYNMHIIMNTKYKYLRNNKKYL